MARRRFRRKDLKRPDEFVSRGFEVITWARANTRLLSWALGAVALGVMIAMGVVWMRASRVQEANEALSHGLADLRARKFSEAATQLADVANRWQSTAAGPLARFYAAGANLDADNVETATVLLQDALKTSDSAPYLKQGALVNLGYALEQKGDAQAASARYAEAAAINGPYTAFAILGDARCREQLGDKEKALSLYERFKTEFPQAADSEGVDLKVAALKG